MQDEICKMLNMDKAYVTRELNSLARLDYIRREKDDLDHRKNHVYVTKAGKKAATEIERVRNEWSAIKYEGFSEDEKLLFLEKLHKIQANIRNKIMG